MSKLFFQSLLVLLCWHSSSITFAQKTKQVNAILKIIEGQFSNKAQADTTSLRHLKHQEFIALRVFKKNKLADSWLYFGWFAKSLNGELLTERFVKIPPCQSDTCMATFYAIPNDFREARIWENPHAFDNINISELEWNCEQKFFWKSNEHNQLELHCISMDTCVSEREFLYNAYWLHTVFGRNYFIQYHEFFDLHGKTLFDYKNTGNVFKKK